MTPEIQTRATEILRASATRPPEERRTYAVQACEGDQELRAMVETMLDGAAGDPGATQIVEAETQVLPKTDSEPGVSSGPKSTPAVRSRSTPSGVPSSGLGTSAMRKKVDSGDLAGHQIGQYELLRRIGKGGMGTVYSARRVDQEFRKLVAIKFVKPGLETDEIVQRFRQERQVLASLDHPNIARLIDGGTDRGVPYLVMEFVEGTPIDDYCRARRLTVNERLNLFCTVCSAVQYAHQSLVVHRDIKPSNILVSPDGTPKLLDFGIAKVLHAEFGDHDMTGATERPMTPDFASPEQVRGEPVTTSSDVYALGVLLFELLTSGHPLRHAYKKLGFDRAVLEVEPERPSTIASQLPANTVDIPEGSPEKLRNKLRGDLDAIVLMALRKEPQRRYASVQHFAEDIQRYLHGEPVRAQRDTLGYRAGKFVRRHTAGVLAAGVAILALIASSIITFSFYRQASRERLRAESRFSDVRQLANFVLFQFDKKIIEGTTPARKALIEKATEYLDRLEKDRGEDPAIERELVEGYLKIGDLQGNMNGPNLGDPEGARKSYEHAMRILDSARATEPMLVAKTRVRLADLLGTNGSTQDAIAAYTKSMKVFEDAGPGDQQARQALLTTLGKLAQAQERVGDFPSAVRSYDKMSAIAKELDDANPGSTEHLAMAINGELRAGYLRAQMNEVAGLPQMEHALRTYEDIAGNNPNSAGARRQVAIAAALIGDVLVDSNRFREAAIRYRRALDVTEQSASQDPRNEQYQRDIPTFLARLAEAEMQSGNTSAAHDYTRRALIALRPLINKPDASEVTIYAYVRTLITTPFKDLRDDAGARRYAERAVQLSKGQDPGALDLLARTQAATGDFRAAVETESKAIGMLPPNSQTQVRTELETNLTAFQARRTPPPLQ